MAKTEFNKILGLFNISGFGTTKTTTLSMLRKFWSISVCLIPLFLLVLELVYNFEGMETMIRTMEMLPVLLVVLSEMCFLVRHKKDLQSLIAKTELTLADFYPKEIKDIGERDMKFVSKSLKIYICFIGLTIIQLNVKAYIYRLPFILTYREKDMGTIYWAFVFFVDMNNILIMSVIYNGCNCFFLYFVGHVVSEMKMLNKAFLELDFDINSRKFRILIEYHKHLLSIVEDFNDIYSSVTFGIYILNFFSLCFALFCCTLDGFPPDMENIVRYGNTAIVFAFVLASFSYSGELLEQQFQHLAQIIFYRMMNQSFGDRRLKFVCFMITGRSRKNNCIHIGGFWDLNLETYFSTMMKGVSFITFLQTMKQ